MVQAHLYPRGGLEGLLDHPPAPGDQVDQDQRWMGVQATWWGQNSCKVVNVLVGLTI